MVRKKTNIQKESFFQAGQELLQKVRQNEAVSDADVWAAWKRLEARLDREHTRKLRIRYGWSALAASVALLLAVGVGFWVTERDDSAVSLSLLDKEVPALNENEVVLIAQNDRMQLKDESSVVYGEDGQADLKEQVVKKVSEPETKKEEETKINQIVVPKGRKVDITFSDGTKMYVNAGSRVIYPALFAKDKREIVVEGEVYLDVRKDPSRPFIVKTKEFEVKVLGTQFNVCAYEEDAESSVVLVEGKVEVQTEMGNGKTTLAPNQLIAVSEGGISVKVCHRSQRRSFDYYIHSNQRLAIRVFYITRDGDFPFLLHNRNWVIFPYRFFFTHNDLTVIYDILNICSVKHLVQDVFHTPVCHIDIHFPVQVDIRTVIHKNKLTVLLDVGKYIFDTASIHLDGQPC